MIKLLIGGSPCTFWSVAQRKHRETEPDGMGWELFKNYLLAREKLFSITSPIWAWTLRPFSWQSMSTTRGANTATEGNAPKPR